MDRGKANDFYQECLNTDLDSMLQLIINTKSEEEKSFYADICNFIMRKRQKECIINGIF